MAVNITKEIKYNKSKTGFQCLGPCYQPNTMIVHPITFDYTTDRNNPFCPVMEWEYIDPQTGKKTNKMTDQCFNPSHNKNISGSELEQTILTPYLDFNCEMFLKMYYNIYSFEDALGYLDTKKYTPISTRLRIIECAWSSFGKKVDIIDERLVDFYIEIIKKKWIWYIYDRLYRYIDINSDSKIRLVDPSKSKGMKDNKNEYKNSKINYLIDKFINHDEIHKFFAKYVKYRKDEWDNILRHSTKIRDDLTEYIENKIKLTLSL